MGNVIGGSLLGPVYWVYDYFFGNKTCLWCEKTIGPELCHVENGKSIWFNGHEWAILVGALAVVASMFVFFLGEDLYLFAEIFGEWGTVFVDAVKVLAWPFTSSWHAIKWLVMETFKWLDWVAEKTGTYPEIWRLIGAELVLLGLTEAGYEITKAAYGEPHDSPFWKVYHFLNAPVLAIHGIWNKLFTSKWNPIHYLVYFFLIPAEVLVMTLTFCLNALNPVYWYHKLKK